MAENGKGAPKPTQQVIIETKKRFEELKKCISVKSMRSLKRKDLKMETKLGEGGFGKVYHAVHRTTKNQYAVKKIALKKLVKSENQITTTNEIEILLRLNHNNIIKLNTCFYDKKNIYIVLEFAENSDLHNKISDKGLNQEESKKFIYQVSSALDYCHSNNIIHRDMKPHNVLIDRNFNAKLADFGLAVYARPSRKTPKIATNNKHELNLASCFYALSPQKMKCGTLQYMAPEILKNKAYNETVDNWALGVVCFYCLEGSTPFDHENLDEVSKKIKKCSINYPSSIPPGAKDLISKLLKPQPNQRLTLSDVMSHFWITEQKD